MKKIFVVLITLLCISISYAEESNTLTIAWPSNAGPLDPHEYDSNQMYAQILVYDGLVRYSSKGMEPALAESYTVSKDGLVYTFKLGNRKFSDGTKLTADIVVMNFNRVMQNKDNHSWLTLIDVIDKYYAKDERTFILKLKRPYNLTLHALSVTRPFRILAPSGFKDNGKSFKKPVGTGPYTLVETKMGKYDLFKRNEYYYGVKPKYEYVKVLVLPDANSRIIALETGKIDMLLGEDSFTIENFVRLSKNKIMAAYKSEPRTTNMIAFNTGKNLTKDINIRKAVIMAVNKDNIIKYILLNEEDKADFIFNPALEYCNIGLKPYEYNLKAANQLLDESGWKLKGIYRQKDGQELSINLHYIGVDPKQKAIAEALQADLMNAGIKLNLIAEESTIFYSLQETGKFDMIFNKTWGPPFDPGTFIGGMRTPSHADYQAQSGIPDRQNLIKEITNMLLAVDNKIVAEKYKYILTLLHNQAVYLPISYEKDLALVRKDRVKNFQFGEQVAEFMLHIMEPVK